MLTVLLAIILLPFAATTAMGVLFVIASVVVSILRTITGE